MGREALVDATVNGEAAEVRALLESHELILRGAIKRRYPRAALERVRVEGDALCFVCAGETVSLELGAKTAEAWRAIIAAPPPSLREKLGLAKGARAFALGQLDDDALRDALEGVQAEEGVADMVVARVETQAHVDAAITAHAGRPIWFVYRKGKGVPFGDGPIREKLRAAGFKDTKSCAVSEALTATRYHPA